MNAESAIDLSMKSGHLSNRELDSTGVAQEDVPILRPTPRPPWSIIWYQNLWPTSVLQNSLSETLPTTTIIPQRENAFNYRSSPLLTPASITPSLAISKFEKDQPTSHATSYYTIATTDSRSTTDNQLFLHEGHSSFGRNLPSSLTWTKSQSEQLHEPSIPLPPAPLPRINCITSESPTIAKPLSNDTNDNQGKQFQHESHSIFRQQESNSSCDSSRTDLRENCGENLKSQFRRVRVQANNGTVQVGDTDINKISEPQTTPSATIIDTACCDGPVRFERISNPNFALTVEHQHPTEPPPHQQTSLPPLKSGDDTRRTSQAPTDHATRTTSGTPSPTSSTTMDAGSRSQSSPANTKTYLCIYCNQSFKSLFCYQKHKKRHLNPVSVDITGVNVNTPTVYAPENHVRTKDLNVQFFPCKKCGCKFPSYYFVHKHKKTCHS